MARTWVCRFERRIDTGELCCGFRVVKYLRAWRARLIMEGPLGFDVKREEMERDTWRIFSPEGARGKVIGAI
jgi:hypothetical protein